MGTTPFKYIQKNLAALRTAHGGGWVFMLVLQGIYLALDTTEVATENLLFGVAASAFMGTLGVLILTYAIIEAYRDRKFIPHPWIEGIFYLFFAIIILYFRVRRYHPKGEEEDEEE